MTSQDVVFDFYTIDLAFEFANCGDRSNNAYLDRQTGKSLFFSPYADFEEEPEDLDSDRYVAVPNIRDFGFGSQLAFEFAKEVEPKLLEDVRDAFRGRGGFSRFKDLLHRNNLLESWYQYEAEHERNFILQWCADNNIRYTMNEPTDE